MNKQETAALANELIDTCIDGEQGFTVCSEHVASDALKTIFQSRAAECRQAAAELQALVTRLGGVSTAHGTARAAVHRGWMALKGRLIGYSDQSLLHDCERGEDAALAAYRRALGWALSGEARVLIERQYGGARRHHDQIRRLRDEVRGLGA